MADLNEKRYTAVEVAQMLNFKSERSVTRLCKNGRLAPAYKLGQTWQIPESTLQAFVEQSSNQAALKAA